MKVRAIITGSLLVFVGVSVLYLIYDEGFRQKPPTGTAPSEEKPGDPAAGEANGAVAESHGTSHRVIVYYFHRTARCKTCLAMEQYTGETLKTAFPEEMKEGILVWRVVNVEETVNEHFVTDYDLSGSAVVLVEAWEDEQVRFTNLPSVWELVHDKEAFMAYIEAETADFLGGIG